MVYYRTGDSKGGAKKAPALVLALGVSSTSLSAANMSAPLFGVLKIEPEMAVRGVLQVGVRRLN